jgi:hypothetical protein
MKDYLNEINDKFPIRRSQNEKKAFVCYVCSELGNGRVKVETLEKNDNIVIGDPYMADIVFTAHYDTPAASPVPNFMTPANKLLGSLIQICFPLVMALFSLALSFGISEILGLGENVTIIIYLLLYFGLFFCSTRLISNKHNKNDNTSGVATVMSLANNYSGPKAAFILFDNEEKGLRGSKAFNKKYHKMMENKLVVNFDCVGNGDQLVFIAKETAEATEEYWLLTELFSENTEGFTIHHIPFKKSPGNSDHKSFSKSIGVMAANSGKVLKLVTGRIHTSRDRVADVKNITFLSTKFTTLIERL